MFSFGSSKGSGRQHNPNSFFLSESWNLLPVVVLLLAAVYMGSFLLGIVKYFGFKNQFW
jgi:hypothetical protein